MAFFDHNRQGPLFVEQLTNEEKALRKYSGPVLSKARLDKAMLREKPNDSFRRVFNKRFLTGKKVPSKINDKKRSGGKRTRKNYRNYKRSTRKNYRNYKRSTRKNRK